MSHSIPPPWTGPENDYRGIADRAAAASPSVAVVIPVFNRAESLLRSLAGFAAQTHHDFELIVADDGSTEDIAGAVAQAGLAVQPTVLRQDRDGFGAHRARNLGAAAATAEVLVFVDADCIPHPQLIERHVWWHARAGNVVVAGSRAHVDAGEFDLADVASGAALQARIAETAPVPPDDWRRLFYRRNKQLTMGDAAFRAGVSSNLSMRRTAFETVGGFSTAFQEWGGEDTELTWRLWNRGMFVVPDNRAIIYHQTQTDPLGTAGRDEARSRAVALVADLVPHRFYRKVASPFHSVPKVTWIARTETPAETDRLWRELSSASYADAEIMLVGPNTAWNHLESAAANAARLTLIDLEDGPRAAIEQAQGEYVAMTDGRARIDRRLLARAVGRLERNPRVGSARCSYKLGDNRQYRRLEDVLRIDTEHGRDGFPFFAVIRRRELLKDPALLGSLTELVPASLARGGVEHLINDHAGIELPATPEPRLPKPTDLLAAGSREVAKAGVRAARSLRRRRESGRAPATAPRPEGIRVNYIGFTGRDNLGDEAVLAGVRQLLPDLEIGRDLDSPEVLMVGGGTLINGKGYYLTRVLRNDSPDLERVLLGTGVRSPEFWGTTEDISEWSSFIESSLYAGVRGPDSITYLAELGHRGKLDIFGDPALALRPPSNVEPVSGRVVVCPVHTAGNLWGGSDDAVFAKLADTTRRLRSAGHEVVMMSAFPADDRWLIEIMRAAEATDAAYLPGYADLDATMQMLASADLVVGERLHASILAAACATPFVALEYRPKIRDFAKSIGMEAQVVRTDDLDRLDAVISATIAAGDQIRGELADAVAAIRRHQSATAAELTKQLSQLLR
jgi:glycosyltransferase involved in cell wall biosynthesis/polysaccharide pyruvyl transferase WcaK-like protein